MTSDSVTSLESERFSQHDIKPESEAVSVARSDVTAWALDSLSQVLEQTPATDCNKER